MNYLRDYTLLFCNTGKAHRIVLRTVHKVRPSYRCPGHEERMKAHIARVARDDPDMPARLRTMSDDVYMERLAKTQAYMREYMKKNRHKYKTR